jgi:hypothetical protein
MLPTAVILIGEPPKSLTSFCHPLVIPSNLRAMLREKELTSLVCKSIWLVISIGRGIWRVRRNDQTIAADGLGDIAELVILDKDLRTGAGMHALRNNIFKDVVVDVCLGEAERRSAR